MKKVTLFVVLLLTCLFAYSQDFEKNAEFFKDDKEAVIPKNKIKVNVLGPFYGYAAVFYERDFIRKFSIETGLGISTRNFYRDFLHMFDLVNSNTKLYRTYDHRKPGYGLFFSIQPKYSISTSREGLYLGIQYQYLLSPYKAEKTGNGGKYTNEFYKEKVKQSNILFNIGYNTNVKKLTLDYGFGYGIYLSNEDRYYQDYRGAGFATDRKSIGILVDVQLKIGGIF